MGKKRKIGVPPRNRVASAERGRDTQGGRDEVGVRKEGREGREKENSLQLILLGGRKKRRDEGGKKHIKGKKRKKLISI